MEDKLTGSSGNVHTQYEKAAKLKQLQQPQGSEMVKNDQPAMQLTPNGSMREASDRQSYNDRLATERADAMQRNADLNAKKQKQQELEKQKGKDDQQKSR